MKLRSLLLLACALLGSGCAHRRQSEKVGELEVLTFRRLHANTFVVRDGAGHAVLIDSGYPEEAEALDAELREAGIDPSKLGAVVVTHAHTDHAGGALHFREKYGVKLVAGAGDEAQLARGVHDPLCPVGFVAERRLAEDQSRTFTGWKADLAVTPGEPLPLQGLAGLPGRVLAVPGHTPGSVLVQIPGAVLVGDLLRGSIPGSGATRHFYMCDLEANRRDVRSLLLETAPDATRVFPGHFGPLSREAVLEEFGPTP